MTPGPPILGLTVGAAAATNDIVDADVLGWLTRFNECGELPSDSAAVGIREELEPLDIGIYARGASYYFGYENGDSSEVIAMLDAATDPGERNRLDGQAQRILADDEASIFVFQLAKIGVRNSKLMGMWANSPIQANDVTGAYWVD